MFEVNLPPEMPGAWSASFKDISYGATDINAPCVHDGVHLGGLTKIGPQSILLLFVYGREWEPPALGNEASIEGPEDREEAATS